MLTVDFKRLAIAPGYKILDIGCGSGRHMGEALKFSRVTAIGADIDPAEVHKTRERLALHAQMGACRSPWGACVADITELPFDTAAFDLVICSEILEHVADQKRALREIVRVLKPDKTLVVSVPRYLPERICWRLSKDYTRNAGGHIRIYKKRRLIRLLEAAGAKKWGLRYAHALHTPYWWLRCLVGVKREDSGIANLYHRFLVWDIMKRPWLTRALDSLLNPLLGKSLVLYLRKEQNA